MISKYSMVVSDASTRQIAYFAIEGQGYELSKSANVPSSLSSHCLQHNSLKMSGVEEAMPGVRRPQPLVVVFRSPQSDKCDFGHAFESLLKQPFSCDTTIALHSILLHHTSNHYDADLAAEMFADVADVL